jgi:hypothetical protein
LEINPPVLALPYSEELLHCLRQLIADKSAERDGFTSTTEG